ncbi:universal stress protein [Actinomycetospora chlora]|uniref:universal stress protein n=1 Tax=Actinomycetospora chlora TaxID=663608 RepID=UPI0031E710E8
MRRDEGARPVGVVRAFAPCGPGRHAVVSWAQRQAHRTGARTEILVDPDRPAGGRSPVDLLVRGFDLLTGWSSLVDRLGRAAAGARLLVVPQELDGLERLVDTAYEAVAVVPPDPPRHRGPVVLALASRTGDEAVDAAFEAAACRHAPLLALRYRDPERAAVVTSEDAAEATSEERRTWSERLAAWRFAYTTVPVDVEVTDGDPALELVDVSGHARLLVVGRSARGRLLGSLTPSPVAAVARHARCPVLVVPPGGPPRRSWWPRT